MCALGGAIWIGVLGGATWMCVLGGATWNLPVQLVFLGKFHLRPLDDRPRNLQWSNVCNFLRSFRPSTGSRPGPRLRYEFGTQPKFATQGFVQSLDFHQKLDGYSRDIDQNPDGNSRDIDQNAHPSSIGILVETLIVIRTLMGTAGILTKTLMGTSK